MINTARRVSANASAGNHDIFVLTDILQHGAPYLHRPGTPPPIIMSFWYSTIQMVIDLLEFLCSCERCFGSARQQGAKKWAWKTILST